MLCFVLIMLLFAIAGYFRGPVLSGGSMLWFFIGWLPGELPWLFALVQIVVMSVFILFCEAIGLVEIGSILVALITLFIWLHLHLKTLRSAAVFQAALRSALGDDFESSLVTNNGVTSLSVIRPRNWLNPFRYKRKGVVRLKNITYGATPRHQLDIYSVPNSSQDKSPRPVLLHIHGGGWVMGHKHQQAQPLLQHLAQHGWICVDINYRLAPQHRYPACLIDIKKAIVWVKENIANYGGNPDFIALTGGSAGGHLCALAALTPNQPEFQPGFETSDTEIQAAVPVYGVFNFCEQQNHSLRLRRLLEKYVMPHTFAEHRDDWQAASPVFQSANTSLPIFVVHGDKDCVVPVQQAQDFVRVLQQKSTMPVVYAELPGAQHGFDIFHSVRTECHIEAVGKFLHHCYVNRK